MMVNKYDPRLKKYEELVQTFACGESVFEEIMEDINVSESQTLSRQSWIITGARGIGKSHIIALLYREILRSPELGRYWMPLIFPEELFTVDSLYRLLLEVFENIWRNINHSDKTDKLKNDFLELKKVRITGSLKQKKDEKQRLAKELFALLVQTKEVLDKKFILLLENLQYLFRQQMPEDDQKILRAFLNENPEVFIIIGTALTVFDEIENYGKPFYHFFRIRNVETLDKDGIVKFLQKIADFRKDTRIYNRIENNRHYIYTYSILTGGNPRLVLFLYELLNDYEELTTKIILEKVSELTPYFLDKTKDESQQRKLILDALASNTPAQTATEIAEYINEDQKSITEQLKRLSSEGWIKEVTLQTKDIKHNEVFYALRDYFYRIWYKLRTGNIDESEIYCMAELACLLFDQKQIEERLEKHKPFGGYKALIYEKAYELVRDEKYITNINLLVKASEEQEKEEIKKLSDEIQSYYENQQWEEILKTAQELFKFPTEKDNAYFRLGFAYNELKEYKRAIECYEKAIAIKPDYYKAWSNIGNVYNDLGEYKRAIECCEKAIAIKPDFHQAWFNMGFAYDELNKYEKAFFSYTQSIKYNPSYDVIYFPNFPKLIDIASSVFTASAELQRLLDKSSTIAVKIESLSRLLLMGKFTAVNDSFDEILTTDNLPLDETKMLDFFLEGYIFEMLKKGQVYGELKVVFKCWIRLNERMLKDEPLKLRKKYLEFFYFYLKTAGKEHVSLNVIHSIMDELKREGVEISDIVVTIIKAVKEPDTREAQKWMADPLFKEIVTMLS